MKQDQSSMLPGDGDAGCTGSWTLPSTGVSGPRETVGRFLGWSSSTSYQHKRHPEPWAPQGVWCPACRWTEFRIFREGGKRGRFVLHFSGMSNVPGEITFSRYVTVLTSPELVEALTRRGKGHPFIPQAAARVLAQASAFDDDVRDAYENRRVA